MTATETGGGGVTATETGGGGVTATARLTDGTTPDTEHLRSTETHHG